MPGVGDLRGCGGALGNCGGSGTWSEDAGLTNVQNPGQFLSDFGEQSDTLDTALQYASDFSAGAGDLLSFGVTRWVRKKIGAADVVNECGATYSAGSWTGFALSSMGGVAGGVKAAGTKMAGREFSHWIPARMGGPRTILNGNYVSVAEHALSDPSRYRFMPRAWKEANPLPGVLARQLARIPNLLTGTVFGSAVTAFGRALGGSSCGAN